MMMIEQAIEALPEDVRQLAARSIKLVSLRHGDKVVRTDVKVDGPMFLLKGVITVSRPCPEGSQVVMCFARQQIWQLGELVASDDKSSFNCAALGDATLALWPREAYLLAYREYPSLREYMRDNNIGIMHRIMRELEVSLTHTLPQRLARRLLQLADLSGEAQANQSIKLGAPVSHSFLAASLGVTRQRIHSQLRDWAALGWLESSYRDVVLLAPQALREASYAGT